MNNSDKPIHPIIRSVSDVALESGLTKREYFAAMAMQAIVTKLPVVDQTGEFGQPVEDKIAYNEDIAASACWIADALLKELDNG